MIPMAGKKKPFLRPTAWYRRIDGKWWTPAGLGETKAKAEGIARRERSLGQYARVLPTPISDVRRHKMGAGKFYDVWISRKSKKDGR